MNLENTADVQQDGLDDAALEELFYIPKPGDVALSRARATMTACTFGALQQIAAAFVGNLENTFWVVTIPEMMTYLGAISFVRQQIFVQERILARARQLEHQLDAPDTDLDGPCDPDDFDLLNQVVDRKLDQQIYQVNNITRERLRSLLVGNASSTKASKELLRQAAVLYWGSLEVLANDLFALLLNTAPHLVLLLMKNEANKKLIRLNSVSIEVLAANEFDLSRSMGDMIARDIPLDSLSRIKVIFSALFPDDTEVRSSLEPSELWLLNQKRHLILHRRGIIDPQYLERTGESLALGQELTITASELKQYARYVESAGCSLISAANNWLQRSVSASMVSRSKEYASS